MSFFTIRLIVELTLNIHFFLRLRLAFGSGWWQLPALLWLGLMLTPMALRIHARTAGEGLFTDILMVLWPLWISYLILFLVASLGLDLGRILAGLAGSLSGRSWWSLLPARRAVPLALLISLGLAAHSYYMAYHPRLVRVEIPTARLPEGVDRLRIVQLTDVHLSRQIGYQDLRRMTALAQSAKPDLLVVTGDLVDTDMSGRLPEAELLAGIKAPYGSFAVTGNHELYAGEWNAVNFYRAAGLRLLRGEAEEAGGLIVAGVDDEVFGGGRDKQAPGPLLRAYDNDPRFVLLLKHRPSLAPGTAGLFDLQLSGHTHGGQIWPGHLIIEKVNGVLNGLHPVPGARGQVYTSRGSGFWGLPMRFLAPAEVTLIELVRSKG